MRASVKSRGGRTPQSGGLDKRLSSKTSGNCEFSPQLDGALTNKLGVESPGSGLLQPQVGAVTAEQPLNTRSPPEEEAARKAQRAGFEFQSREEQYFAKARGAAKAQMSGCFEDLISFFEMHQISGAYALALSAHGIQDLSQLLLMSAGDLDTLICRCELDAVDEILLRDALRGARGE